MGGGRLSSLCLSQLLVLKLVFLLKGKQLQPENMEKKTQYLRDYKIEDKSQLFVVLSVPGGNDPDPTKPNMKKFSLSILLTLKRDTVNFDDNPNNQRTLMPCGHAFGECIIW